MRLILASVMAFAAASLGAPAWRASAADVSGPSADAVRAATTPEQHRAVADAYAREADALRAEARAHENMENGPAKYTAGRRPGASDRMLNTEPAYLTYHCRTLSRELEAAAKEAGVLAQAHRMMADVAALRPK